MDMHQYMAFTLQPLAGESRQWLNQQCHHFAEQVLRERLYPEGLARIEWHRERGDELVLISASGEHLVAPMAKMLGMDHCVAILLDEEEGMLTGQTRGTLEFSRRQGGPHQPALCRAGTASGRGALATATPTTICPCCGAVSHPHAVNPAPRCASAPLSWAGPCGHGSGSLELLNEEEALRPLLCEYPIVCRRYLVLCRGSDPPR